MPVDPKSVVAGKKYVTATRHTRTVLEVTQDRVRYAYGGGESGGVSQWRWQTLVKFAEDAVKELGTDDASNSAPATSSKGGSDETGEPAPSAAPKKAGSRTTLSTRKG